MHYEQLIQTNSMQQNPSWEAYSRSFPAFYGTTIFITVFTASRHWTPSWASWN